MRCALARRRLEEASNGICEPRSSGFASSCREGTSEPLWSGDRLEETRNLTSRPASPCHTPLSSWFSNCVPAWRANHSVLLSSSSLPPCDVSPVFSPSARLRGASFQSARIEAPSSSAAAEPPPRQHAWLSPPLRCLQPRSRASSRASSSPSRGHAAASARRLASSNAQQTASRRSNSWRPQSPSGTSPRRATGRPCCLLTRFELPEARSAPRAAAVHLHSQPAPFLPSDSEPFPLLLKPRSPFTRLAAPPACRAPSPAAAATLRELAAGGREPRSPATSNSKNPVQSDGSERQREDRRGERGDADSVTSKQRSQERRDVERDFEAERGNRATASVGTAEGKSPRSRQGIEGTAAITTWRSRFRAPDENDTFFPHRRADKGFQASLAQQPPSAAYSVHSQRMWPFRWPQPSPSSPAHCPPLLSSSARSPSGAAPPPPSATSSAPSGGIPPSSSHVSTSSLFDRRASRSSPSPSSSLPQPSSLRPPSPPRPSSLHSPANGPPRSASLSASSSSPPDSSSHCRVSATSFASPSLRSSSVSSCYLRPSLPLNSSSPAPESFLRCALRSSPARETGKDPRRAQAPHESPACIWRTPRQRVPRSPVSFSEGDKTCDSVRQLSLQVADSTGDSLPRLARLFPSPNRLRAGLALSEPLKRETPSTSACKYQLPGERTELSPSPRFCLEKEKKRVEAPAAASREAHSSVRYYTPSLPTERRHADKREDAETPARAAGTVAEAERQWRALGTACGEKKRLELSPCSRFFQRVRERERRKGEKSEKRGNEPTRQLLKIKPNTGIPTTAGGVEDLGSLLEPGISPGTRCREKEEAARTPDTRKGIGHKRAAGRGGDAPAIDQARRLERVSEIQNCSEKRRLLDGDWRRGWGRGRGESAWRLQPRLREVRAMKTDKREIDEELSPCSRYFTRTRQRSQNKDTRRDPEVACRETSTREEAAVDRRKRGSPLKAGNDERRRGAAFPQTCLTNRTDTPHSTIYPTTPAPSSSRVSIPGSPSFPPSPPSPLALPSSSYPSSASRVPARRSSAFPPPSSSPSASSSSSCRLESLELRSLVAHPVALLQASHKGEPRPASLRNSPHYFSSRSPPPPPSPWPSAPHASAREDAHVRNASVGAFPSPLPPSLLASPSPFALSCPSSPRSPPALSPLSPVSSLCPLSPSMSPLSPPRSAPLSLRLASAPSAFSPAILSQVSPSFSPFAACLRAERRCGPRAEGAAPTPWVGGLAVHGAAAEALSAQTGTARDALQGQKGGADTGWRELGACKGGRGEAAAPKDRPIRSQQTRENAEKDEACIHGRRGEEKDTGTDNTRRRSRSLSEGEALTPGRVEKKVSRRTENTKQKEDRESHNHRPAERQEKHERQRATGCLPRSEQRGQKHAEGERENEGGREEKRDIADDASEQRKTEEKRKEISEAEKTGECARATGPETGTAARETKGTCLDERERGGRLLRRRSDRETSQETTIDDAQEKVKRNKVENEAKEEKCPASVLDWQAVACGSVEEEEKVASRRKLNWQRKKEPPTGFVALQRQEGGTGSSLKTAEKSHIDGVERDGGHGRGAREAAKGEQRQGLRRQISEGKEREGDAGHVCAQEKGHGPEADRCTAVNSANAASREEAFENSDGRPNSDKERPASRERESESDPSEAATERGDRQRYERATRGAGEKSDRRRDLREAEDARKEGVREKEEEGKAHEEASPLKQTTAISDVKESNHLGPSLGDLSAAEPNGSQSPAVAEKATEHERKKRQIQEENERGHEAARRADERKEKELNTGTEPGIHERGDGEGLQEDRVEGQPEEAEEAALEHGHERDGSRHVSKEGKERETAPEGRHIEAETNTEGICNLQQTEKAEVDPAQRGDADPDKERRGREEKQEKKHSEERPGHEMRAPGGDKTHSGRDELHYADPHEGEAERGGPVKRAARMSETADEADHDRRRNERDGGRQRASFNFSQLLEETDSELKGALHDIEAYVLSLEPYASIRVGFPASPSSSPSPFLFPVASHSPPFLTLWPSPPAVAVPRPFEDCRVLEKTEKNAEKLEKEEQGKSDTTCRADPHSTTMEGVKGEKLFHLPRNLLDLPSLFVPCLPALSAPPCLQAAEECIEEQSKKPLANVLLQPGPYPSFSSFSTASRVPSSNLSRAVESLDTSRVPSRSPRPPSPPADSGRSNSSPAIPNSSYPLHSSSSPSGPSTGHVASTSFSSAPSLSRALSSQAALSLSSSSSCSASSSSASAFVSPSSSSSCSSSPSSSSFSASSSSSSSSSFPSSLPLAGCPQRPLPASPFFPSASAPVAAALCSTQVSSQGCRRRGLPPVPPRSCGLAQRPRKAPMAHSFRSLSASPSPSHGVALRLSSMHAAHARLPGASASQSALPFSPAAHAPSASGPPASSASPSSPSPPLVVSSSLLPSSSPSFPGSAFSACCDSSPNAASAARPSSSAAPPLVRQSAISSPRLHAPRSLHAESPVGSPPSLHSSAANTPEMHAEAPAPQRKASLPAAACPASRASSAASGASLCGVGMRHTSADLPSLLGTTPKPDFRVASRGHPRRPRALPVAISSSASSLPFAADSAASRPSPPPASSHFSSSSLCSVPRQSLPCCSSSPPSAAGGGLSLPRAAGPGTILARRSVYSSHTSSLFPPPSPAPRVPESSASSPPSPCIDVPSLPHPRALPASTPCSSLRQGSVWSPPLQQRPPPSSQPKRQHPAAARQTPLSSASDTGRHSSSPLSSPPCSGSPLSRRPLSAAPSRSPQTRGAPPAASPSSAGLSCSPSPSFAHSSSSAHRDESSPSSSASPPRCPPSRSSSPSTPFSLRYFPPAASSASPCSSGVSTRSPPLCAASPRAPSTASRRCQPASYPSPSPALPLRLPSASLNSDNSVSSSSPRSLQAAPYPRLAYIADSLPSLRTFSSTLSRPPAPASPASDAAFSPSSGLQQPQAVGPSLCADAALRRASPPAASAAPERPSNSIEASSRPSSAGRRTERAPSTCRGVALEELAAPCKFAPNSSERSKEERRSSRCLPHARTRYHGANPPPGGGASQGRASHSSQRLSRAITEAEERPQGDSVSPRQQKLHTSKPTLPPAQRAPTCAAARESEDERRRGRSGAAAKNDQGENGSRGEDRNRVGRREGTTGENEDRRGRLGESERTAAEEKSAHRRGKAERLNRNGGARGRRAGKRRAKEGGKTHAHGEGKRRERQNRDAETSTAGGGVTRACTEPSSAVLQADSAAGGLRASFSPFPQLPRLHSLESPSLGANLEAAIQQQLATPEELSDMRVAPLHHPSASSLAPSSPRASCSASASCIHAEETCGGCLLHVREEGGREREEREQRTATRRRRHAERSYGRGSDSKWGGESEETDPTRLPSTSSHGCGRPSEGKKRRRKEEKSPKSYADFAAASTAFRGDDTPDREARDRQNSRLFSALVACARSLFLLPQEGIDRGEETPLQRPALTLRRAYDQSPERRCSLAAGGAFGLLPSSLTAFASLCRDAGVAETQKARQGLQRGEAESGVALKSDSREENREAERRRRRERQTESRKTKHPEKKESEGSEESQGETAETKSNLKQPRGGWDSWLRQKGNRDFSSSSSFSSASSLQSLELLEDDLEAPPAPCLPSFLPPVSPSSLDNSSPLRSSVTKALRSPSLHVSPAPSFQRARPLCGTAASLLRGGEGVGPSAARQPALAAKWEAAFFPPNPQEGPCPSSSLAPVSSPSIPCSSTSTRASPHSDALPPSLAFSAAPADRREAGEKSRRSTETAKQANFEFSNLLVPPSASPCFWSPREEALSLFFASPPPPLLPLSQGDSTGFRDSPPKRQGRGVPTDSRKPGNVQKRLHGRAQDSNARRAAHTEEGRQEEEDTQEKREIHGAKNSDSGLPRGGASGCKATGESEAGNVFERLFNYRKLKLHHPPSLRESKRQARWIEDERRRRQQETAECTFRPNISRSQRTVSGLRARATERIHCCLCCLSAEAEGRPSRRVVEEGEDEGRREASRKTDAKKGTRKEVSQQEDDKKRERREKGASNERSDRPSESCRERKSIGKRMRHKGEAERRSGSDTEAAASEERKRLSDLQEEESQRHETSDGGHRQRGNGRERAAHKEEKRSLRSTANGGRGDAHEVEDSREEEKKRPKLQSKREGVERDGQSPERSSSGAREPEGESVRSGFKGDGGRRDQEKKQLRGKTVEERKRRTRLETQGERQREAREGRRAAIFSASRSPRDVESPLQASKKKKSKRGRERETWKGVCSTAEEESKRASSSEDLTRISTRGHAERRRTFSSAHTPGPIELQEPPHCRRSTQQMSEKAAYNFSVDGGKSVSPLPRGKAAHKKEPAEHARRQEEEEQKEEVPCADKETEETRHHTELKKRVTSSSSERDDAEKESEKEMYASNRKKRGCVTEKACAHKRALANSQTEAVLSTEESWEAAEETAECGGNEGNNEQEARISADRHSSLSSPSSSSRGSGSDQPALASPPTSGGESDTRREETPGEEEKEGTPLAHRGGRAGIVSGARGPTGSATGEEAKREGEAEEGGQSRRNARNKGRAATTRSSASARENDVPRTQYAESGAARDATSRSLTSSPSPSFPSSPQSPPARRRHASSPAQRRPPFSSPSSSFSSLSSCVASSGASSRASSCRPCSALRGASSSPRRPPDSEGGCHTRSGSPWSSLSQGSNSSEASEGLPRGEGEESKTFEKKNETSSCANRTSRLECEKNRQSERLQKSRAETSACAEKRRRPPGGGASDRVASALSSRCLGRDRSEEREPKESRAWRGGDTDFEDARQGAQERSEGNDCGPQEERCTMRKGEVGERRQETRLREKESTERDRGTEASAGARRVLTRSSTGVWSAAGKSKSKEEAGKDAAREALASSTEKRGADRTAASRSLRDVFRRSRNAAVRRSPDTHRAAGKLTNEPACETRCEKNPLHAARDSKRSFESRALCVAPPPSTKIPSAPASACGRCAGEARHPRARRIGRNLEIVPRESPGRGGASANSLWPPETPGGRGAKHAAEGGGEARRGHEQALQVAGPLSVRRMPARFSGSSWALSASSAFARESLRDLVLSQSEETGSREAGASRPTAGGRRLGLRGSGAHNARTLFLSRSSPSLGAAGRRAGPLEKSARTNKPHAEGGRGGIPLAAGNRRYPRRTVSCDSHLHHVSRGFALPPNSARKRDSGGPLGAGGGHEEEAGQRGEASPLALLTRCELRRGGSGLRTVSPSPPFTGVLRTAAADRDARWRLLLEDEGRGACFRRFCAHDEKTRLPLRRTEARGGEAERRGNDRRGNFVGLHNSHRKCKLREVFSFKPTLFRQRQSREPSASLLSLLRNVDTARLYCAQVAQLRHCAEEKRRLALELRELEALKECTFKPSLRPSSARFPASRTFLPSAASPRSPRSSLLAAEGSHDSALEAAQAQLRVSRSLLSSSARSHALSSSFCPASSAKPLVASASSSLGPLAFDSATSLSAPPPSLSSLSSVGSARSLQRSSSSEEFSSRPSESASPSAASAVSSSVARAAPASTAAALRTLGAASATSLSPSKDSEATRQGPEGKVRSLLTSGDRGTPAALPARTVSSASAISGSHAHACRQPSEQDACAERGNEPRDRGSHRAFADDGERQGSSAGGEAEGSRGKRGGRPARSHFPPPAREAGGSAAARAAAGSAPKAAINPTAPLKPANDSLGRVPPRDSPQTRPSSSEAPSPSPHLSVHPVLPRDSPGAVSSSSSASL